MPKTRFIIQPAAYAYAVGYYMGRLYDKPRCPFRGNAVLIECYHDGFNKGLEDKRDFDNRYTVHREKVG